MSAAFFSTIRIVEASCSAPCDACWSPCLATPLPTIFVVTSRCAASLRVLPVGCSPVGARRVASRIRAFSSGVSHGGDLSQMPAVESGDALLGKSFAPVAQNPGCSRTARTLQSHVWALGQEQDQPAPIGHLPPDPSGYGLAASVPQAANSST